MPQKAVASTAEPIRIHYHRPPDRETVYIQRLVRRLPGVVITCLDHTPLSRPMEVDGRRVLEPGAPVVWFSFPDTCHDIGRFHLADGTFTGIYANVLTPVQGLDGSTWRTTDLFLDVWLAPGAEARVLDEDELADAERAGAVSPDEARVAREEAERLRLEAAAGRWPPPIVADWPLDRVRRALGEAHSAG